MNQEHIEHTTSQAERRPRMSEEESRQRVREDNRKEKELVEELRKRQPLQRSTIGLLEANQLEHVDKDYAEFVMNGEFYMQELVEFAVLARREVLEGEVFEGSDDEELLAQLFEFYSNNKELIQRMKKRLNEEKASHPEKFN